MFLQGIIVLLTSECIFASTSSVCAEVPNGYYVRSSQSCNSYNRCINGQPSHGMCLKGYSFDPLSQTCSPNIDVDCQRCSPYGIQQIPHPDNCAMYYRCANGIRTTMTCSEELLFDRYFGDCNIAQRVICEQKNTICEQFRDINWLGSIVIGNPLDCSSFYYCINGRAIESVCTSGLHYNPYTASCEVLGGVNFCQGIGPIITTPVPELTTREEWTTPSTTKTTVRVIFITKPAATTESTTLQTTETTTEQSTTTLSTTLSTSTSTTTTAATTTESTTITTTEETTEGITEETTEEEEETGTTTLEPSSPGGIEYPNCPAGVTGYFPMPYPDNCTRYYYCSRGIQRFSPYSCTSGQFFTPGNNQCTADVPPGCEYLLE